MSEKTDQIVRRARILVVEDDATIRLSTCRALDKAGFDTTAVTDGESALLFYEAQFFDLILLDLGLPGIAGLEVLSRLVARQPKPKVIIMTGDTNSETVLATVRTQAYQLLAKPVDPARLIDMVRDAIDAGPPSVIEVVSAKADWVELLAACEPSTPDRVQSFLEHLEGPLPEDIRESVGRAFRELLLNAIEWGGNLNPNHQVRISFIRTKRMLMYRIADPGSGFRPDQISHAAIANPNDPVKHVSEREGQGMRPGGFGLLMTRELVDELVYNEAHNEVVFVKYLD